MELLAACDCASLEKLEANLLPPLIEEVRLILLNSHHVSIPPEFTGFIVRCLRVKDYNVERAALLAKSNARCTQKIHDMLDKFEPSLCKDLYTSGVFTVLKSRDHLGRKVILTRVRLWDTKTHDFDQAASAAMLMFGFTVGESMETQRKGVVFINDMTGFGMRHVKAMKTTRLTQLIMLLQDGAPGKIKGMHTIFHPRIAGLVYQILKPFLKEKLSKRIHFHGDDLTSLHKYVGVEVLPASLGGPLGENESTDAALIDKLMNANSVHRQLKSHGITLN